MTVDQGFTTKGQTLKRSSISGKAKGIKRAQGNNGIVFNVSTHVRAERQKESREDRMSLNLKEACIKGKPLENYSTMPISLYKQIIITFTPKKAQSNKGENKDSKGSNA